MGKNSWTFFYKLSQKIKLGSKLSQIRKENLNLNYEELKYGKDYTLDEYRKILEKYSAKNKTPKIN